MHWQVWTVSNLNFYPGIDDTDVKIWFHFIYRHYLKDCKIFKGRTYCLIDIIFLLHHYYLNITSTRLGRIIIRFLFLRHCVYLCWMWNHFFCIFVIWYDIYTRRRYSSNIYKYIQNIRGAQIPSVWGNPTPWARNLRQSIVLNPVSKTRFQEWGQTVL